MYSHHYYRPDDKVKKRLLNKGEKKMVRVVAIVSIALLLCTVFVSKNMLCDEDSDGDGLPDWWEMQYFGGLQYGANDDPDGDGYTNLEEFNAGTDPTDATNKPPRPPVSEID